MVPVSVGEPGSTFPACGPLSPHLGMGANTVQPCSMAPDTQSGAQGGCPPPRRGWRDSGLWEAVLFCLHGPREHGATGLGKKGETDPQPPWLPRTRRAGVGWGLRPLSTWPGGCRLLRLRAGGTTPWYRQRGSWHLVAGRVPARAAESGGRAGTGAVSVGDRRLQLL